jgi:hypothetical protein
MAQMRPDAIDYLTGRLSDRTRPPGIELPDGGGKFTPDGAVQIWPGNTFVCHVDRASAAYEAIRELQEEVKKSVFNRFFTFLPPPSFHMTIYQGLAPGMTVGHGWPADMPKDLSRDEITTHLLNRLASLELPSSYKVKVDGLFCGYSLTMVGADETQVTALRQTRTALCDATGIQFPDFHTYVFHITMAYLIDWLSEKTARELVAFSADLESRFRSAIGIIELGPVEFCNFDSMHHFEPVSILG